MNLVRPRTEVRPVMDENHPGRVGGFQIHHWDGRVDAVVRPLPVRMKVEFKHVGAPLAPSLPVGEHMTVGGAK